MYRFLLALCLGLSFGGFANAQARVAPLLDGPNVLTFTPVDAPFRALSLRYPNSARPDAIFPYLQYRYRTAGTDWTAPQRWLRDAHTGAPGDRYTSARLLLLPANLTELEVYVASLDYAPADAALLRIYTPGHSKTNVRPRNGDCTQPAFEARADWCPAGTCTAHPNPAPTLPSHLIVHHSATPNTTTDYPALVRSIWDFHVNTNGWSDIGYNWLIDPDGTVYLGRGDDVIGAHFCGQNSQTTGICLLGNFVSEAPTAAALSALEALSAWKLDALDRTAAATSVHAPSALDLPHLAAHRDGCNTVCPGDAAYALLPALRTDIDALLADNCGTALAAPADLSATLAADTGVRLDWQDNSANETGFELERAPTVNGPFTRLTTVAADSTTYLDGAVLSNTPYFYRLRAVNATDTTAYSNQVFILTGFVGTTATTTESFSLSPNPSSGTVRVRFSTARPRQLELYDLSGRVLWRSMSNVATTRLALPVLASGVYLLRVRSARGVATRRLVRR